MSFYTYILRCSDDTLYTGITNDLEKRLQAHNELKTGARYTKARRPVVLAYSEKFETKSEAMKRECTLKKLTRSEKLKLILP
ncbi:MAG: GIY-YIG nuclease family protein [Candidatus Paceibacterota bacterium]|jgi:putative endonuclease